MTRAQVDPHAHPRVGPVRHGARLERDERGDLADRRGPQHDDPGRADRDHAVHARDGGLHAARREARRHPRPQPRVRDRPGDLRGRVAHDRAEPQPRGPAGRLVGRRGPWRRARHPGDRGAHRRHLRGPGPRARLRPARGHRRRRGGGRPAHRRLGDDGVLLALRVRRRDRRRDRHPAAAWADRAGSRGRAASATRRRGRGAVVERSGPHGLRDPAQQRVGLRPAAHAADDQRHGDHPAGLLAGAVHGARRPRPAVGVRRLGAALRPRRPRPAARHDAAAHRAAARGARDAAGPAARPHGHLLRHPRLPAGRAGPRRVRDRQAPAPAVGGDARLRAAGAADRGAGARRAPWRSSGWSPSASARS